MQHLTLRNKLIILCIIWTLPVIMLFKIYYDNITTTTKFNQSEMDGSAYLKTAWPVTHTLMMHQVNPADTTSIDLTALAATDQKYGQQFKTAEQFTDVKQKINTLKNSSELTEQKLEPFLSLISQVSSKSNIILDPEANTYFLADVTTAKLPRIYKMLSQTLEIQKKISSGQTVADPHAQSTNIGILDITLSDTGDDLQSAYAADSSGSVKKQLNPLYDDVMKAFNILRESIKKSDLSGDKADFKEKYKVMIEKSNTLWNAVIAEFDRGVKARQAATIQQRNHNMEIVIIMFLCGFTLAFFITRSLDISIARLVKRMSKIQTGKTDIDIPYTTLKTEIGKIARGILDFRDAVKENFDNQDLLEKTVSEVRAENSRLNNASENAIITLADSLERDVGSIAQILSTAASQLSAAAQELKITTTTTRQQTSVAAKSSELTRQYMAVIAPSTEQLSSSIMEISAQVGNASVAASAAVQHTEVTKKQVAELTLAANKIGNIINVIGGIAAQTQLLALNATIEAARAGEAGRGFAVVATEVKTLAVETAKFTGEIDTQINEIQMATKSAVKAIESINKTVLNVSEMNTHIAAAIEEQTATTGDISRNIQTSATETQHTADAVMSVDQAAISAEAAAEQVVIVAADVGAQAHKLQSDLSAFLKNLRHRKAA